MPASVAKTLCNAYELGKKKHEEFGGERLENVRFPLQIPLRG